MSPHSELRAATREVHDRIDARFARFDLGARDHYAQFLLLHARAYLPAEAALTAAGAADLIPDWLAMRRAPALLADLDELSTAVSEPKAPPAYSNAAEVFGGAYVLEGSRLGGAVLRRAVGPGLPRRFLDSVQPPGRWRRFIAALDANLYEPSDLGVAVKAALGTFALFEDQGASASA